jgi:hypothetical protein
MSARHAVGDFSFVFLLLLVLAWVAESYPPIALCFTFGPGGGCDLPGADLLFVWSLTFQAATIPLGLPITIYAVIETISRVRRRPTAA